MARPTRAQFKIEPIKGRVAVLASGGLDSSILLAKCAAQSDEVFPFYIRSGLIWERQELVALQKFIRKLNRATIRKPIVIEMPMRDITRADWTTTGTNVPACDAAISSNYIMGRNLALLSKAAIVCARERIGEIAMALLRGNPFPDARPEFLRSFSTTARLGLGLSLRISAPFAKLTKPQVIQWGQSLPLELTVSCIQPRGLLHCGDCTKCAERARAFATARIKDPTRYARQLREAFDG
jgi:7-cyano-7-deazaguanine synthase